jgi:PAS domain-containing protein
MKKRPVRSAEHDEQPLELILARNLISIVTLAAFLVDVEGRIVFYNDATAEVIGTRFEETGSLTREQWNAEFGPLDGRGHPLASDRLPLATALREGRPAYGHYRIRAAAGVVEVEAGALPLVGPAGYRGAIVVFWTLDDADAR